MSTKLRLGPIPSKEYVKLTITLSTQLKDDLNRYAAEVHAKTLEAHHSKPQRIPHMLESFMARDRGFRKAGR